MCLMGIIVHGLGSYALIYEGGTGISKKNIVCAGLVYVLNDWLDQRKYLPDTLHVQLDNCASDNKNHTVLGLLGHLVGCGVVKRAQVVYCLQNLPLKCANLIKYILGVYRSPAPAWSTFLTFLT